MPNYKRYLDEMPGVPLQDLWGDIKPIGSQAAERLGYPRVIQYKMILKGGSVSNTR